LSAISATPARFGVESFLVSLNAFPAKEMQFAIGPDGLDHVVGYPVTTLATPYCRLFGHINCLDYEALTH
jgi:hypothetical protein